MSAKPKQLDRSIWGFDVTRLEDMLPSGTEAEWTCGHIGGAVCAECHRLLIQKANELAEENLRLRELLSESGLSN